MCPADRPDFAPGCPSWQGKVNETLTLLEPLKNPQAHKFCDYLRTYRQRIPNYEYYQCEGIPIGSGSVESWVKQIDRRTQISGAQWRCDSHAMGLR